MNTLKTFLLIIALCVIAIGATANNSSPTWEYKLESGVSEKNLNARAAEGWEVAATGNFNGGMPYVILKRSK